VTLSTAPAAIPARTPFPADSFPDESARTFLILSNVKKRTLALRAVPWMAFSIRPRHLKRELTITRLEQPVYSDPNPSFRTTRLITANGFLSSLCPRSCKRVFANSKGYCSLSTLLRIQFKGFFIEALQLLLPLDRLQSLQLSVRQWETLIADS
jgi:hypothetical protein